jgi:hypothetical protein
VEWLDLSTRKLKLSYHARLRMLQREIRTAEIRAILPKLQVIEDRPNDLPHPTKLLLGWCDGRPLHIVLAFPFESQEIIVVSAYDPREEADRWCEGFSARRR